MLTNKYGYLQRISNEGSSEELSCSTDVQFQGGGSTSGISFNTPVTQYASFEQDRFKLTNSKYDSFYLASDSSEVNHVTVNQSDESGNFETPINILIERRDQKKFFQNGITFISANFILSLGVKAWATDGTYSVDFDLTDADSVKNDLGYAKKQTFFVDIEQADKVQVTVKKIDKPFNFFYCFNLNVGIEEELKGDKLLSVTIQNKFPVYGETLEYSTIDFELRKDGVDRNFQKKEKIQVLKESDGSFEPSQGAFFARETTKTDFSILVNCEDVVSLLEEEFEGGMFNNTSVGFLLEYILGEDLLPYCYISADLYSVPVSGYFPILTKREAIQQVIVGCNVRKYKYGGVDSFSLFKKEVNDFIYDESKILENPQIIKNQPLKELKVRQHAFAKGRETKEVYHGNATLGVKHLLDEPFWSLGLFRYTNFEDSGDEISLDATKFLNVYPNHFEFKSATAFDVIVKGRKYIDNVTEISRKNPNVGKNQEGLIKTFDLYVYSDIQAVCDLLYELYTRPYSIRFRTLYEPNLGEMYNILGHTLNIRSVSEKLDGIYEVEAC